MSDGSGDDPNASMVTGTFDGSVGEWELVARICISAAFGAMIGFEREMNNPNACVRMHMLVGAGAACFIGTSVMNTVATMAGDPSRVAAGIVSGVGFLGAATIMKDSTTGGARGLGTAAGVWVVASIGTAVGYGYYIIGGMATLLTMLIQYGAFFFLRPKFWHMVGQRFKANTETFTEAEEERVKATGESNSDSEEPPSETM